VVRIELDQFLPPGSNAWWVFAALTLFGRATDLFSTWVGTPNLILEANPLARRLGWRLGVPFNLAIAIGFACWPLLAVSLTTTSLLVAGRNFKFAWLMRVMGEIRYHDWLAQRIIESRWWLVVVCHLAEASFSALVGAALMVFANWQLIPFGIGLGICGYAGAVGFYTMLALWRLRT
jgi:hypothetical protein